MSGTDSISFRGLTQNITIWSLSRFLCLGTAPAALSGVLNASLPSSSSSAALNSPLSIALLSDISCLLAASSIRELSFGELKGGGGSRNEWLSEEVMAAAEKEELGATKYEAAVLNDGKNEVVLLMTLKAS